MKNMQTLKVRKTMRRDVAEKLKGTFLTDDSFDTLITEDTDAYDLYGNLLFRYRKNAIPFFVFRLKHRLDNNKNLNM